jgi:ferredoxin-nitrite reductase
MDNVRNVMTCPLTGVSSHELVDAMPVVREMNAVIVGNKALSSLPRKFNVLITGCTDNCLPVETQDIAMVPAFRPVGVQTVCGFNVLVGGKSGSGGLTPARSLDVFVEPHEAVEVGAAIISLFSEFGSRQTRSEARLYFLLEAWGVERFRSQLETLLGRDLTRSGQDARGDTETDHLGIEPERMVGSFSVGMAIPSGKLTSAQVLKLADLAEKYGGGEVRLTVTQNVVLPYVAEGHLPSLLEEPLLRDLRPDPLPALRGTVSCTGLGTCDLALANTKEKSLEVATQIDKAFRSAKPLAISWSGCPAACTNHRCATIGVQGDKARVNNEVVEVYHVFVNGRSGKAPQAGVRVLSDVPADRIGHVIERLARIHSDGGDLEAAGLALAAGSLPEPSAETILA